MQPQPNIQELLRRLGVPMVPSDHPVYQEGPLVILGAPQPPQAELPPSPMEDQAP
jgi:hypothetical protein